MRTLARPSFPVHFFSSRYSSAWRWWWLLSHGKVYLLSVSTSVGIKWTSNIRVKSEVQCPAVSLTCQSLQRKLLKHHPQELEGSTLSSHYKSEEGQKTWLTYSAMKSLNSGDQSNGFLSLGEGFLGIWNKALMGWRCDNGGSPSANSMAVIPRDHTSHRESYAYSSCLSHTITSCLNKMRAKKNE